MRQTFFLLLLVISISEASAFTKMPGLDSIYGVDDRDLIGPNSKDDIKELAKSVALITSVDNLDIRFFKTTIKASILQSTAVKEDGNLCISEKFATRPSLNACTGFLVAPDILATASHCFATQDDCATKKVIFDVNYKKQSSDGYLVSTHDVYSCDYIISSGAIDTSDYALIKLNKAPKGRKPLKLNPDRTLDRASVFMIGHPLGLPLMHSKTVNVVKNDGKYIFKAPLDSFDGNSGSPVFNARTQQVEGILVGGQEDFVKDPKDECYRYMTYKSGGEEIMRIEFLLPFIKL